jgi:2-polyprenyl-3-methyl-5-hydroxy-6-metoxy-1,4-benzoquinol methylase
MENWKQIWNRRSITDPNDLQDLINANGYESTGLTEKNLTQYVQYIKSKMEMTEGETVYEVGCGSGAILFILKGMGLEVGGLDYSESLIEISNSLNISTDFDVNEAIRLNTEVKYDHVISNSIFHYFPNLHYAEEVIKLMMKKSKGSIAILDVNDEDKKDLSLNIRKEKEPNYDEKYKGFEHLFINKTFWEDLANENNWSLEIEDQSIKGYKNTEFRYNIFLKK